MKAKRRRRLLAALLLLLAAVSAGAFRYFHAGEKDSGVKYLIGMSQANLVEPWRVTMNREIQAEAAKYADMRVVFTDAEQSSKKQINDVKNLMAEGIDLLIISPNEADRLTPVIQQIYRQIPVIVLDRSINGYGYSLFIGSDNERIGEQAGRLICKLMKNRQANAVEVLGNPMSKQAADRSDGFLKVIQSSPNCRLAGTVVGNWLSDKAEDELKAFLPAHPEVNAIFAQTDEMAKGAFRAVKALKKEGIVIIGVGGISGSGGGLAMVRDGTLAATFVSRTGGAEAVQCAYSLLTDKMGLPKRIILQSDLVTPENAQQYLTGKSRKQAVSSGRGKKPVLGFVQVGSESGWRTDNTVSIQSAAKEMGVELRFVNANGSQQREIEAIASFVRQKVDVIAFSPLVETGWDKVLQQAKDAGIPVICMDRGVSVGDESLCSTFIGSDFVEEGRRAANWLVANEKKPGKLNVVEIQGTPGSTPAIGREQGFGSVLRDFPNYSISALDPGFFTYEGGRKAMENLLNYEKKIDVVFAQNDDMALGAIETMRNRGLTPGKDVTVISVDGTKSARRAVGSGELSCTVECNSQLGPLLMRAVLDYSEGKELPLRIITAESVFPSDGQP